MYGRIFSVFKNKLHLINIPFVPDNLKPSLTFKTTFIHHDPWNKRDDLIEGNFTFLNQTEALNFPPNWETDTNIKLLWLFNLHYFNYLNLLSEKERIQICYDWIDKNGFGQGAGWHPYVISLRLISWCKNGFNDEKINKSIYLQAAYLYCNLEYYHPANHYLENARALIFAGSYFREQGEAQKWLKKGVDIYLKETSKQVLNDGGYFEKSIMYHAIMLEGYLDIINILPEQHVNYSFFKANAAKMLEFLMAATHPDGYISLFNDSTQEIAPSSKELIDYAKRLNLSTSELEKSSSHSNNQPITQIFPTSGYYIYKNNNVYLIIDGGSIGPDFIPAHAHADIFSYELSIGGVQFIVDSGVYEYNSSEMRKYVRSTKAHNTVSIDGIDQAECWGSFRVSRRYKPFDVLFQENNDAVFFEGKFGGYAELIGDNLVHHRKVEIDKGKSVISIEDNVKGNGEHLVESFIHLHPNVKVIEDEDNLILSRNGVEIILSILNSARSIENGWYCPEFGKKIENKVIRIYSNKVPGKLSYRLFV